LDELDGRIPLVIDAGPTQHGLESTIIAVRENTIEILRCGPLTKEELSIFGAKVDVVGSRDKSSAPGQSPSHYAPKTPLQLIDNAESCAAEKNQRIGLLAWHPSESEKRFAAVRRLSERQDMREAAANFFRYLRELDALALDFIVAERVPLRGLGAAIMDRLQRAAYRPRNEQDRPQ